MRFGIFGNLGCGKTILAVFICLKYWLNGWDVYSNLKMPFSKTLDSISDVRFMSYCIIFIDDIGSWLDSRESNSNIFVTWSFMATRKLFVKIIYTSQLESMQDKRLRGVTNVITYPFLMEFPVFGIDFYMPNGDFLTDIVIQYGKDVTEIYDTYQLAYQKMKMSELIFWMDDLGDRDMFTLVLNLKKNVQKSIGRDLYKFLDKKKYQYVPDIVMRGGYVLEDDVGVLAV